MAPLAGLTGVLPDNTPVGETGRDPTEWGHPANPVHGVPGDASGQFPAGRKQAAVYPAEIPEGRFAQGAPEGTVYDHTPTSHAAPVLRGISHDLALDAAGSQALHGQGLGGSRLKDYHVPYPEHPDWALTESAGTSALAAPPGQLRQGTDVDQGDGQANSGTFGRWHQFRQWFRDPVPRNYGSVGERPFFGKHPIETTRFDNNSAYEQQGDTSQGMNLGPTPTSIPNPYVQPPNPTVAPAAGYPESPWAW